MRTIQPMHLFVMIIILAFSLVSCSKTMQLHQKAYELSESGYYQQAIKLYEEMMATKSGDPLHLNDYGWTLFMADSMQAALEKFEKASNVHKKGHNILKRNIDKNLTINKTYLKVKKHLRQGEPEAAKELLDQIDRSWKPREMRLKYYALTYEKLGNEEKADELWQKILDFYPEGGIRNHFQQLASNKLKE